VAQQEPQGLPAPVGLLDHQEQRELPVLQGLLGHQDRVVQQV